MFFDRLRPTQAVLGQIRDTLARIAKDTAFTLADLNRFREQTMARLDDLDARFDEQNGGDGTEPQQPEQPATGGPDQPTEPRPAEPTNPADNPNEQPQR